MLRGSRWKEICAECGHLVDEEDAQYIGGRGPLCHQCYGKPQDSQKREQREDTRWEPLTPKGTSWKEVCVECGHLVEEENALYLGDKGPLCPPCHSNCLSAKRQKAERRVGWIPFRPALSLIEILIVVAIVGFIASQVIPGLLGIRHASKVDIAALGIVELTELRTILDQNRDTQVGRIAQDLITYGSQPQGEDSRPQPLYSAKELERLLQENNSAPSEDPVDKIDADVQEPVEGKEKMRQLLGEAIEFADVPRQLVAQFAAEMSRSWEAGEFNADVGAVIALLQRYRQEYGVETEGKR